ncbi:MAG: AMP-binding protein [Salipiger thiooxidans]
MQTPNRIPGCGLLGGLFRIQRRQPDALAFIEGGRRVGIGEWLADVGRAASWLLEQGVTTGDRVAMISESRYDVFVLLGACAATGAILAPLNWRQSEEELEVQLADAAPALRLGDGGAPPDSWRAGAVGAVPTEDPDAPLLMIYTAATDGRPKGALLSGAALVSAGQQLAQGLGVTRGDRFLGALPPFHVMGIGFALSVLLAGGSVLLQPRFDPAAAVHAIDAEGVTLMGSFPPMLGSVLDAAKGSRLEALRAVIGLDTPETMALLEAETDRARFWTGYGQTETAGLITLAPPGANAGAGWAMPLTELRIDPDSGEILMRGPAAMLGYHGREDATAHAFRGGWLHTGDLGEFGPSGELLFRGPAADKLLIKTGGENVYPAEVEGALLAHPLISAAMVIGLPDERWGEVVAAICVRGGEIDPAILSEFVGRHIARYKRPKRIVFVQALPPQPTNASACEDLRALFETAERF